MTNATNGCEQRVTTLMTYPSTTIATRTISITIAQLADQRVKSQRIVAKLDRNQAGEVEFKVLNQLMHEYKNKLH